MMKRLLFLLIGFLTVLLIFSAIPKTINYQGKLVDSDGAGINSTLPITFALYTSDTNGEAIWTENQTVVVNKGLFSVILGSVTEFPSEVDFSTQYWLEITIDGETLTEREKLTATPYAMHADKVTHAIQSVYSEADETRRTGSFKFRAGEGATLEDDGSAINITIGSCGTSSGAIPSLQNVLIEGNNAAGLRIENLGAPSTLTDAATMDYVDNFSVSSITGGAALTLDTPTQGDVTLDVQVDNLTLGIASDKLYVLDGGIDTDQIQTSAVTSSEIADGTIINEDISTIAEIEWSKIDKTGSSFNDLADVNISTPSSGDVAFYDGSQWVNFPRGSGGQVLAMNAEGNSLLWETPEARAVYNFLLDVEPSADGVQAGNSVYTDITARSLTGTPMEIGFYTSALPSGVTPEFTPSSSCSPSGGPPSSCTVRLTLSTTSGATRGTYPLSITGATSGGSVNSAIYLLTIATTPGQVGDLTASADVTSITLEWIAPSDNGGSLVTGYNVYRDGVLVAELGSVLTYEDTGLTAATEYTYSVRAINSIGEGEPSNINITTLYREHCKAILDAGESSGDGFYTIDPYGTGPIEPVQAYCDMNTDGGGWTIGTFNNLNTSVNSMTTFKSACETRGFMYAGRGVNNTNAWLAMKRMLHNSNHWLKQQGWPTSNAYLVMPIIKNGSHASNLYIIYDNTQINRSTEFPSNLTGDHCDGSTTEIWCGYWYNNGWSDTNLNNFPDPEDWGTGNLHTNTWFSCMFR